MTMLDAIRYDVLRYVHTQDTMTMVRYGRGRSASLNYPSGGGIYLLIYSAGKAGINMEWGIFEPEIK